MKKLVAAGLLVFVGAWALRDLGAAQGGTYRGPGGGPSHGDPKYRGPGDTLGTGNPAHPASDRFALVEMLPAISSSARGTTSLFDLPFAPRGPRNGGMRAAFDLSDWRAWWRFNQHTYCASNLPPRPHPLLPGSDEFFLAGGGDAPTARSVRDEVVATLLGVLRAPRSKDEQLAALVALAKLGDAPGESEVLDALTPFLIAPNRELAEIVPFALGLAGGDAGIDWQCDLLRADAQAIARRGVELNGVISTRMQAYAAYGLGFAGRRADERSRERVVQALVDALVEDRQGQRVARSAEIGVACVLAIGMVPLPFDARVVAGQQLAPHARADSREREILCLLGLLDDHAQAEVVRARIPEAIADLLGDAPDAHWLRQAVATELCTRIERDSLEARLVRIDCVIALGALGDADDSAHDAQIRAALLRARTETRDLDLANFALIALARGAGRPGSDANPWAGSFAVHELVLELFAQSSAGSRNWTALAIGVLERGLNDHDHALGSQGVEALRNGLDMARSPDEIAALATALGIARDTNSSSLMLRKLAQVAEGHARADLAIAIGLSGDRSSIVPLERLLRDAKLDADLQRSTAIALALLEDADVVPLLTDSLRSSPNLATRASAAVALGWIGDARASAALLALVGDESDAAFARAFAIRALGRIADGEVLSWNNPLAIDVNFMASTPAWSSPDSGTGVFEML